MTTRISHVPSNFGSGSCLDFHPLKKLDHTRTPHPEEPPHVVPLSGRQTLTPAFQLFPVFGNGNFVRRLLIPRGHTAPMPNRDSGLRNRRRAAVQPPKVVGRSALNALPPRTGYPNPSYGLARTWALVIIRSPRQRTPWKNVRICRFAGQCEAHCFTGGHVCSRRYSYSITSAFSNNTFSSGTF